MQNHREAVTFEDFASQVFSPSPGYPMSGTGETTNHTRSRRRSGPPPSQPLRRWMGAFASSPSPSSAHLPPFLHFLHICPPAPLCLRWSMNIKRGGPGTFPPPVRLQTPPLPQSLPPAVVSVCSCFRAATFPCNYFPCEYRKAFKVAMPSVCFHARSLILMSSFAVLKRSDRQTAAGSLSAEDDQNGKCVLSCSPYL